MDSANAYKLVTFVAHYAANRIPSASVAKSFECTALLIRKYYVSRCLAIFRRSSVAISRQYYHPSRLQLRRSSLGVSKIKNFLVFQSETTTADIFG